MSDELTPEVNPYDLVPYHDFPYPFSHPRHLEATATLFGMGPPDITRGRVLELGCAGGGNLIPQAVDLPGSRFLGIDFSERQIAEGRRLVEQLGLENIELRQANILEVDKSWGEFDYIIAHGVFSWVPPQVQDKLLAICSSNLAPNGVAYVSYNTYPGWHLAGYVRGLMCYHARQFRDPADQIAQAKAILKHLAELGSEHDAAGLLLRKEWEKLSALNNDSYIFHEHLENDNYPIYFHEFIARAQSQGLRYLAESEVPTMLVQNMPEKARQWLSALPIIALEQYADFLHARRFRMTLLCHQAVKLNRELTPEVIKRFHLGLARKIDSGAVDIRNEDRVEFAAKGKKLGVTNRLAKAGLVYLGEIYPRQAPFRQVYATARARVEALSRDEQDPRRLSEEVLAAALLTGFTVGMVAATVHPPTCVSQPGRCPVASPLARLQAERGRQVTNQQHQFTSLGAVGRRILRRLDGRHDRQDLLGCVRESIEAGEVPALKGQTPPKRLDPKTIERVLDQELARLTQAGLLVG